MDFLFIGVVIFLFMLAVFDLWVGVSNDAVNFLTSALGSKAAPLKRVLLVASVGVFVGAAMSNGMMDIARHGIFRPENFSFYEIICIFMAVMVTDIILLDVFNTLGMPTSTTVSMVFELLGATFVVALIKMAAGAGVGFSELLNTEKALSVILGIFLSVAIAFFFGTLVQFLARTVFTFNYRSRLKWKIGIFGGVCTTAIVYFLLLKGVSNMAFMTPAVKAWINSHTAVIILGSLGVFTVVMQALHALKVNVLKVIVLMGTFALAMAFAGNDLVNFIGVPLSGLSAWQDFAANGSGDAHGFLMDSLNGPADTPVYFLIGAGIIVAIMHFGSYWAMIALGLATIALLIRSNRRFKERCKEERGDVLFQTILAEKDPAEAWHLLRMYITGRQESFIGLAAQCYDELTRAFLADNPRPLGKTERALRQTKTVLKNDRRKQTLCLRQVDRPTAMEMNTWFYLGNNCCMSILYNLRRMAEACREHVDNNFRPLPQAYVDEFELLRTRIGVLFNDVLTMMNQEAIPAVPLLRRHCDELKGALSANYHRLRQHLHEEDPESMSVLYVYLNLLQESREMVSSLRKYLRAYAKLYTPDF